MELNIYYYFSDKKMHKNSYKKKIFSINFKISYINDIIHINENKKIIVHTNYVKYVNIYNNF